MGKKIILLVALLIWGGLYATETGFTTDIKEVKIVNPDLGGYIVAYSEEDNTVFILDPWGLCSWVWFNTGLGKIILIKEDFSKGILIELGRTERKCKVWIVKELQGY